MRNSGKLLMLLAAAAAIFLRKLDAVDAASGLQLSVEPKDEVTEQGRSARLDCQAKSQAGTPEPRIQWRWEETAVNFIGDRYRIQLPNGSLYISHVNHETIGRYQCLASVENVGAIVSRVAKVRTATLPVFEREPQDLMVYAGQIAYLSCRLISSDYSMYIQWLKDEQPLVLDESRMTILPSGALEIAEVLPQDIGSYRCNASGYGQYRMSNKAQLTLQTTDMGEGESAPVFIARPFDQIALEKSTVTLECSANGNPKPEVFWLKDGTSIDLASLDSRYQIVGASSLVITDVTEDDHGSYQCRAKNSIESLDADAELTVQVPPRFIKKPHDKEASERQDLEFECEIYGKPDPAITWLKNGEKITLSNYWQLVNGYNLRINGLLKIDAGIFQCMGANVAGSVQASARLTIHQPNNSAGFGFNEPKVPPPRNLSAGVISSRFVALRWQEPESGDISNYLVYFKQEGFERERIERTPTNEPTVTIKDLQPGTTYVFRAVANISNVISQSSNLLHLLTEEEPNVPGKPQNLRANATSPNSIFLSWEKPTVPYGYISSYLVTYAEGNNEEIKRNTTSLSYEIMELEPYQEYNIWVQAVNENGPGASTPEIRVRTFSAPPTQPPHNVSLDAISSTSILVGWEPPLQGRNGVITGYKIKYRPMDRRSDTKTITTEGDKRSVTLTKLEKRPGYQVRVCAFNVNGTGPYTEWETVEIYESDSTDDEVPQQPSTLKTKATSDSIIVGWTPPKEQKIKVRGYVLTWGKGIPDEYKKVLDGKTKYFTIENLEPNSEYVISLRAKNDAGEGVPIYETVKTIERQVSDSTSPLSPPVGLKAIVISPSSVVLQWIDLTLPKNQYQSDRGYYIIRYLAHRNRCALHDRNCEKKVNTSELNFMVHDLKPNTEYEFAVKAVKGRRESPWSMVVVNKTLEAKPSSPPKDLVVQNSDENPRSVLVSWQPPKQPNGEINGYIISYTTDNTKNDRDWTAEGVIGDKSEYVLSDELQPSTTYYFKIQARNSKGTGPYSQAVSFKTSENTGKILPHMLMYIITGCSAVILFGVAVVLYVVCCQRSQDSERKNGYIKDGNCKTNIKPPDLWIHHDQMELKALESKCNGDASASEAASNNTLPRSSNPDSYSREGSTHINTNSLDKRTYVPSYMGNGDDKCSTLSRQYLRGSHKPKLITLPVDSTPLHQPIATATPIINSSLSSQALHNLCGDMPTVRQNCARTLAQYSLNRAHITLEPTPESSPDACILGSSYEPLQTQLYTSGGAQSYNATSQYNSSTYVDSNHSAASGTSDSSTGSKRLQGHPLKSFSVPAPPQSLPTTPANKHGISQVAVRPNISSSPFKKTSSGLLKNRLTSITSTNHTPEEIERLKPSYSTEELNQEMANLEGLMKDLNAITASEFEC